MSRDNDRNRYIINSSSAQTAGNFYCSRLMFVNVKNVDYRIQVVFCEHVSYNYLFHVCRKCTAVRSHTLTDCSCCCCCYVWCGNYFVVVAISDCFVTDFVVLIPLLLFSFFFILTLLITLHDRKKNTNRQKIIKMILCCNCELG